MNSILRYHDRAIHPFHAVLLSFPLPLFLGAFFSDIAYWRSYQIQWSNFTQWLNAGGLLIGAFVILWALINLFRYSAADYRPLIYFITLLAMWVIGLWSAFVHARDAWATMPDGLWLSAITAMLAIIATWIGYSGFRYHEVV